MTLHFEGAQCFRQRIVCATLSGKSVVIKNIRHMDETPGLQGNTFLRCKLTTLRFRSQFVALDGQTDERLQNRD